MIVRIPFHFCSKSESRASPRESTAMTTPLDAPLELKQTQHAPKSLKHKSKNKRPSPTGGSSAGSSTTAAPLASSASSASAVGDCGHSHHHGHGHHHHHGHSHGAVVGGGRKGSPSAVSAAVAEDKLRDLLASKIAEIEVGGDENLELPIDLSGIYLDDSIPQKTLNSMQSVLDDAALSGDEKAARLAVQIKKRDDLALLQKKISEINSRCIVLKQRKNAVNAELVKTNASKAKLEQLCRELQKQNKLIVTESRRIADEEDKKRRELSTQFQKTIEEVSAKMDQQSQDYMTSLKENESLQQKLKGFLEQYAAREEHFKKQLEAKDLTVQLAEAKLQHQVELTTQEAERAKLTLEKAKRVAEREAQLQSQLTAYSEKFEVVQETLQKSNEMFTTFRSEMDKLSKQTKKLEKENTALKKKCDEYDRGAIGAIQEKVQAAEETNKLQEKIKKLESLCRQLQAERKTAKE